MGWMEKMECGVRSAECEMRSAECGVRSVENEECEKCGVWKMRSVENEECGILFLFNFLKNYSIFLRTHCLAKICVHRQ